MTFIYGGVTFSTNLNIADSVCTCTKFCWLHFLSCLPQRVWRFTYLSSPWPRSPRTGWPSAHAWWRSRGRTAMWRCSEFPILRASLEDKHEKNSKYSKAKKQTFGFGCSFFSGMFRFVAAQIVHRFSTAFTRPSTFDRFVRRRAIWHEQYGLICTQIVSYMYSSTMFDMLSYLALTKCAACSLEPRLMERLARMCGRATSQSCPSKKLGREVGKWESFSGNSRQIQANNVGWDLMNAPEQSTELLRGQELKLISDWLERFAIRNI